MDENLGKIDVAYENLRKDALLTLRAIQIYKENNPDIPKEAKTELNKITSILKELSNQSLELVKEWKRL